MSGLILTPPPSSTGVMKKISEAITHHSKIDAANIRIMTAAIVVLFSVVLFIIALHLYAKWFWKNAQLSHHRRRPEVGLDDEIDEAPEAEQSTGLQKSVIESLPTFTYSAESMQKGVECAVCLCELEENEKGRFLPKCNHIFHTDCIDMWFRSHSTCPLCRLSIAWPPTSTTVPIDFTSLDIVLLAHHENGDASVLQQFQETSSVDQQERLLLSSAAESKALNKQQVQQGGSAMASSHFAIELPRPFCESTCGSCSGHPIPSAALCPKSPLSRFSLRRILSRDRKVAPSASTSADFHEEGSFPASLPCHPSAL